MSLLHRKSHYNSKSNYNFTLLNFNYTFNNSTTDCPILNFPQIIPDTIKHLLRSVCYRLNSRSIEGRSIEAMPSKSGIKLGSCTICPSSVFHSTTEKQGHFSIFHHDYTHQQSIKQTETEHSRNFKLRTGECNLSFPSLKKL